jgi:hypothetical protein
MPPPLCPPGANAGKADPAGIPRRIEADSGRHRHPLQGRTVGRMDGRGRRCYTALALNFLERRAHLCLALLSRDIARRNLSPRR